MIVATGQIPLLPCGDAKRVAHQPSWRGDPRMPRAKEHRLFPIGGSYGRQQIATPFPSITVVSYGSTGAITLARAVSAQNGKTKPTFRWRR
jgi:hypothetical protein